ncbi:MAG: phosphate acyltransferase PlsX [Verrucomicrobiaceae bacterium]|nr:phosphate acyltransferase PlsX [Verrucomicrobiaceae bacterium]
MKIAIDVMGGDFAPQNNIGGVKLALEALPKIEKLYLVGTPAVVEAELKRQGVSSPKIQVVASSQVVDMTDNGLATVRSKKDSSMSVAARLVRDKECEAVVSAGHTGAAVTAGTLIMGRIPGVDFPGIASPMPNEHGTCYIVDAGANPDAKAKHLVQYAIMGSVYTRHVHGRNNPIIGLMNIGEEEGKGNELAREAADLLRKAPVNFHGNVEGHDLFETPLDVIVCDGFTGNVVLKTAEATAKVVFKWVKAEMSSGSPLLRAWKKLGGALVRPYLRNVRAKGNYDTYGGSPLLGVKGVLIIAHGSSSPLAIMNAIRVAGEAIEHHVGPHIEAAIQQHVLAENASD